MKNKKNIIICISIIAIIIVIGIIVYLKVNKRQDTEEKQVEEQQEDTKIPDAVIQGMEDNRIEGFKVTKIEIFKTSDKSFDVKAHIVNNSNETIEGFFTIIGLYDKNGKKVTEISENHEEEIKSGETYILESGVVYEKGISEITSAKIISLEKKLKATIDETFDEIEEKAKP